MRVSDRAKAFEKGAAVSSALRSTSAHVLNTPESLPPPRPPRTSDDVGNNGGGVLPAPRKSNSLRGVSGAVAPDVAEPPRSPRGSKTTGTTPGPPPVDIDAEAPPPELSPRPSVHRSSARPVSRQPSASEASASVAPTRALPHGPAPPAAVSPEPQSSDGRANAPLVPTKPKSLGRKDGSRLAARVPLGTPQSFGTSSPSGSLRASSAAALQSTFAAPSAPELGGSKSSGSARASTVAPVDSAVAASQLHSSSSSLSLSASAVAHDGGAVPLEPPSGRVRAQSVVSSREELLEAKLLELQLAHMVLVDRCASYETFINNSSQVEAVKLRNRASSGTSSDLLGKLRGKLKENKTRKEQKEALVESGGMDAEFWNQRQRKIKLDLSRLQVMEPLVDAVGGSLARLHVVEVDGFVCVMKELDIGFAKELNVNLVKTFESEVQFLETLPAHPNIVRYLFHHFDHEKGRARLFMTKYSSSLRDVLVRRMLGIGDTASGAHWCQCCPKCSAIQSGRATPLHLSPNEAAAILLDIALGIQFLHQHQILHRDLKSDNIFVVLDEQRDIQRVLIGDFDSAKKMKELQNRMSTVGTPGYIAPEVWSRGAPDHGSGSDSVVMCYTFASDVYSFGILIFELLSFRRPFEEMRGIAIQQRLLDHDATMADLRAHIPAALEKDYAVLVAMCQECIHIDPGMRPSVAFLVLSLKNILFGKPTSPSLSPRP